MEIFCWNKPKSKILHLSSIHQKGYVRRPAKVFWSHCVFLSGNEFKKGCAILHSSHSVTFLVQVFWLECIGEKNSSLTHFFLIPPPFLINKSYQKLFMVFSCDLKTIACNTIKIPVNDLLSKVNWKSLGKGINFQFSTYKET